MKRYLLVVLQVLLTGQLVTGQTFQDMISRLNSLPAGSRQAVVDSFMNSGHTFPFVESDTLTHFIYQGSAANVLVAGDATFWNPQLAMSHITGTNFWYNTVTYPADARLDYKYVLDGSNWILDPLNPYTCMGGYGPNSELRMPAYVFPPELSYHPEIPHGTIRDTTFQSAALGNSREVKIYLPPGYNASTGEYPVILFHDGLEYISLAQTNNIFDYLIDQKKIVPLIGIFVPPVDRSAEYTGNKIDKFTTFIVDELMPVIDQKYRTSKDPKKRAMAGASNGGNISLYIGIKHPESFGKVAAQSSNVISSVSSSLQNGNKLDLEFFIDIGTYDIAELIPMVHNLADILQSRNYSYRFFEWHEGHSWGNWKGHLRLPLMQFFSGPNSINENRIPPELRLQQNRPNPFSVQTLIPYSIPSGSSAELCLLDARGRMLERHFIGQAQQQEQFFTFINYSYPPGTYLYNLRSGGYSITKKMTIIK